MPKTLVFRSLFILCCLVPICSFTQESAPAAPADPMIQSINNALDQGVDTPDRPDSPFGEGGSRTSGAVGQLMQGIAALCVVVALILGVYYAIRRWGRGVPMLAGPNLGRVLGRVYLDKGTALHFVRIGDRVLVVGVNGNAISTVGEFNASTFDSGNAAPSARAQSEPFNPDSFLAELRERSLELKESAIVSPSEEDEIAALRGDIQRLQRYLRDENREHEV